MKKKVKVFIGLATLILIVVGMTFWNWTIIEKNLVTSQLEQTEIQQRLIDGESIIVETLEAPEVGSPPKGGTYVWEFRITNPTGRIMEVIYDLKYPESGYSGAVVITDPDCPGPEREFYYSFGQKVPLRSEHILHISLALLPDVEPHEIQMTFGIYHGTRG